MSAQPSPVRRRSTWWLLLAGALIAVLVWQAMVWSSTPRGDAAAQRRVAGDTATGLSVYPRAERVTSPPLDGTTLTGDRLSLSTYAGKIVVINVWGSWCGPCRAETPDLARAARELEASGVRFIGVDTRDNLSAARAFTRRYDVPYPSVVDEDGELLLGFRFIIPTAVVPTTIVIDREGKVAARVIGPVTYRTLRGLLDDEIALDEVAS